MVICFICQFLVTMAMLNEGNGLKEEYSRTISAKFWFCGFSREDTNVMLHSHIPLMQVKFVSNANRIH